MIRSHRILPRLRVVALTALLTATMVTVDAAPVARPAASAGDQRASAPLPFGLGPSPVQALYCATPNPAFTGWLTQTFSSTSHPVAARIGATSATIYGYISNVDTTWACTLYRRYSGVAWNTAATTGTFDWGTMINSTSVGCNWVVGADDYLRAADTTTCASTSSSTVLAVTLTPQGVYQPSTAHTAVGQFSYAHSDCDTTPYSGAEVVLTGKTFSTGSSTNRPNANCDAITLDSTGTAQTITLDGTAPTGAAISIAGGAAYTTTASVTLTTAATDAVAGVTLMRFSNDNVTFSAWQAYTTSASWTLAAGDGTRTVYAQFQDANGNTSASVSDTIVLDTVNPTGSISINNGATYTTTSAATLNLTQADATSGPYQMRFSNDNVTWTTWEAATATRAWTLTTGDGTKTVYYQVSDHAGRTSASVSDTIVLDTVNPTGSISINNAATYTTTTAATLNLTQADATSGPYQMRFSNDNVTFSAWQGVAATRAWTLTSGDGTKTVYYQVSDHAGRTSGVYSDTIVLDTSPGTPNPPDVACAGTGVYQAAINGVCYFRPAAAATLTLTATVSDPGSGIAYTTFQNLTPTTGWIPSPALPANDTTSPYTEALGFSASAVTATIGVLARNGAGLDTSVRTASLHADTEGPRTTWTAPLGTTRQPSDALTVSWTEADYDAPGSSTAGAGFLARSLKEQTRGVDAAGACTGSWTDSGRTWTSVSPVAVSGLRVNTCYQYLATLTDRVGNVLVSAASGTVIRDTTANLGRQSQHRFETWDLGSGDGLAVNVANGNLVLTHPIVSLPIRGSAVSLALTYNSQDPASLLAPSTAPGWRLSVHRRLTLNADGSVTFTGQDGARATFTSPQTVGTVTTYTRPASLYATLVKDTNQTANEFILTDRDQSKDKFDILGSEGILVRAEDRFGNGVDLAYVGGTNRINTITDTAGNRTLSFGYDGSSRLTSITDWAYVDASGEVQETATGSHRVYRFLYDAGGDLAGWADPLNTTGTCPTGGSHVTCVTDAAGLLATIAKTQTVTTTGATALGTAVRSPGNGNAVTTQITYAGSNVATVKDAEQVSLGGSGVATSFTPTSPTQLQVTRPSTTTLYGLVSANDPYARVASVGRHDAEDGVDIEQRTAWDATYPVEPASTTANYGALLSTPAVTTSYTYVASSLGLLSRLVEPLTASTNRRTDYTYNANNNVATVTVSQDGTNAHTTKSCYSADCVANDGLSLLRQIDNYVAAGPQNADTNVTTDFTSDAYGQRTRETRHNRDASGATLDDRATGFTYDTLGNQTSQIANYADGVVTNGTSDTVPDATGARTDLTTTYSYDTAGNRVSSADPRRAIGLAIPNTTVATFTPTDDAHVRDAAPTTNYGAATILEARSTGGSQGSYEPYLAFTVTGIVGNVTGATLRLHNTATANKSTRTVCLYRVADTTWTEGAITDATKPPGDPASLVCITGDQAAGTIDYVLPAGAVTGPGIYAFKLVNDTTFDVQYASKEDGVNPGPQLLVTVSYGPLAADDWVSRSSFDALNEGVSDQTPKTFGLSDQKTSTTTYDELGNLRQATDTGGVVTGSAFDRDGRATVAFEDTDGSGSGAPATTGTTTYDPDGHVLSAKDRNQVAQIAFGATGHAYDSLGREITVTDAAGSTPDVASVTSTTYDALDRTVSSDLAGQATVSTYDLGGRVLTTDDGFACTRSTYDHRDLTLTTTTGLVGGTCASGSDTRTVTNTVDGLGRQTRAEVTAGTGTGNRTQDDVLDAAGNRLLSASRTGGVTATTTYTLNLLDQVTAELRPDGSTAKSTFDPAGNATDRCTWAPGTTVGACLVVGSAPWSNPPGQNTSTTYDARNARLQLVDGVTNATTVYDPNHTYQPAAVYTPTGSGHELQVLYTYDARHRLASITAQACTLSGTGHACASTVAAGSDTYAYDDNDNRTRVNEANGAASLDRYYCYDARDQLTTRGTGTGCSGSDETYTYDDAGNRLTAGTTTFSYNADGQLTACSVGCGTIASDSAGRITSLAGWSFAYDSEGRLTSACQAASCTGSGFNRLDATYDGAGHRTQLKETTAAGVVTTTDFRYAGDAITAELVGGTLARTFVTDDAGRITKLCVPDCTGSNPVYLVTWNGHGDALGLWRVNADGTLTLANSYQYDTWGKPTTTVASGFTDLGFRFLYVGASDVQWDNAFGLGLLYMHARHYSPVLGRFLQPDPARAEANTYSYAVNSPASQIDPSGYCTLALVWIPYVGPAVSAVTCGYAAIIAVGAVAGVAIGWGISQVNVQENRRQGLAAEARAFQWIWRPGRYYAFHVWFPTTRGSRYLDICEWNSVWAYLGNRFRPNQCWEIKSGDAAYLGTEQWRRDQELMATFHFPIRYRRSWGIMEWP